MSSAFEPHTQHHTAIIPYEPKEEPSESQLHCGVGFALFCKYLLLSNTVTFVAPADRLLCGRRLIACKEIAAKLGHTKDLDKPAHACGEWSRLCACNSRAVTN